MQLHQAPMDAELGLILDRTQVCLVCRVCRPSGITDRPTPRHLQLLTLSRHVVLLLSVFRYIFSFLIFNYYSSWARFTYRLAFVSAAVTYGIVVYKGHFARGVQGSVPAIVTKLISDENVQYLGKYSAIRTSLAQHRNRS